MTIRASTIESIKKNQGDFYTACDECIICDYPTQVAPLLVKMYINSEGEKSICYFARQPETPEEVDLAIKAIDSSCVLALRYRGKDSDILHKLSSLGLSSNCDHLIQKRFALGTDKYRAE